MFEFHLFGDLMVAKLEFFQKQFSLFLIGGVLGHFLPNLVLNFLERLHIVLRDETDRDARIADSGSSAHSVHITFGIAQVIVNNDFHHVNIQSSGRHLRTDQNADLVFLKLFQTNNALHLTHITMQALDFLAHLLQQQGNPLTAELRLRKDNDLLAGVLVQQVQQVTILEL
jgi:hypothetical protein